MFTKLMYCKHLHSPINNLFGEIAFDIYLNFSTRILTVYKINYSEFHEFLDLIFYFAIPVNTKIREIRLNCSPPEGIRV